LKRGYTPAEIKDYISKHTELLNPASSNMPGKGGLYRSNYGGVKLDVLTGFKLTSPGNYFSTCARSLPKRLNLNTQLALSYQYPQSSPVFVAAPTPRRLQPHGLQFQQHMALAASSFGGEDVKAAEAARLFRRRNI
jgi:hypothetical protein